MKLILASASPRRRELLSSLGLSFDVIPADGPETPPQEADAGRTAWYLSQQKALQVARAHPDALVIGADTVVAAKGGCILGKPRDEADARRMLHLLSGRDHWVYTGVCLTRYGAPGVPLYTDIDMGKTRVFFREMTDAEIDAYIATGEPMDKAGAYGYQGRAARYVERIEGDYYNVVGLPLCLLSEMLSKAGVELH